MLAGNLFLLSNKIMCLVSFCAYQAFMKFGPPLKIPNKHKSLRLYFVLHCKLPESFLHQVCILECPFIFYTVCHVMSIMSFDFVCSQIVESGE